MQGKNVAGADIEAVAVDLYILVARIFAGKVVKPEPVTCVDADLLEELYSDSSRSPHFEMTENFAFFINRPRFPFRLGFCIKNVTETEFRAGVCEQFDCRAEFVLDVAKDGKGEGGSIDRSFGTHCQFTRFFCEIEPRFYSEAEGQVVIVGCSELETFEGYALAYLYVRGKSAQTNVILQVPGIHEYLCVRSKTENCGCSYA